jgi:conjugal transfer ATP-binding protein TraC
MRAEQTADSIWKDQGFTINNVAFIHRPALLASLPLALSPELEKDLYQLRISSTKSVQNAVALAPLLGEWRGTKTPVMMFAGRRGQPTSFDLYDSIGNYNAAIVGTSGAGKSSTIAELAWSYLGTGAKVWILDLGRTFQKLCIKANGSFLEFHSKCGININPFTHVVDFQDDYSMLQSVLIKMASPDRDLEDAFQRQALGDALTQQWLKHGTQLTVTHIRDLLATGSLREGEETDRRLRDLAMMLSPYSKGGAYANFFDGPCNIDLSNPLTVIEFEELKRSPALHHVTTLILLFRITSEMYFDRSVRKLFIVDELKQQLGADQDPTLVTIIEEAARRARKYGGCLITATQEVEDYYASDALKTAFSLADHKFILRQSKESLALLMKNEKLAIDDNRKRLLESLTLVPGAYTELYLYTPDSSGLLRLPMDPYAQLLFSNRIEDNAPIDEKRARGLTIDEAITELIAERGGRAA